MIRSIVLISFIVSTLLSKEYFLRSEYETVGTILGAIAEGISITSGNEDGYYTLNTSSGELTIAKEIDDLFDFVTSHELLIETSYGIDTVIVADGYDFLVSNHSGTVLSEHQEIDTNGEWTAYNNLWGKGTAVPNEDFRIAILVSDSLPDSSIMVWDAPGTAKENFDGASVWCYTNMMFGNRTGQREDLERFPFLLDSLAELTLEFDYTPILGDDKFKVALNCFLTDEDTLTPFSENDGDFFMVFDQVGTWIPPYPDTVVTDTLLEGYPYTLLYKEENGYEWRRVIIKDHARYQQGTVDLLGLFKRFEEEGMVNMQQSIPNIQFGVEVTEGFGAIHFNKLNLNMKLKDSTPVTEKLTVKKRDVEIRNSGGQLQLSIDEPADLSVMSLDGRLVEKQSNFLSGIVGEDLSQGVYLIQVNGVVKKVVVP